MKVYLVIPAYNEANNIGAVIVSCEKIISRIIIVDDASTDQTVEVLKKFKIIHIRNRTNMGYAKSIETGLKKAFWDGADYAITFDADGQHDPNDLPKILALLKKNQPDLVLGIRNKKNRIMEHILGYYASIFFGFSDPLCGLKVISQKIFNQYGFLEKKYTIGTELIFKAIANGAKYIEIPINVRERKGQAQFGNALKGNWLEFKALVSLLFI